MRVFASLHPGVAIVVGAIAAILTCGLIQGVYASYQLGHMTTDVFGIAGMLVFLYVITMIGFWSEAYKVRRFLRQIIGR